MQAKRFFNTSGPNNPTENYTVQRSKLIEKGKDLVYRSRYFTIWAPRQTGKSTYFRQLAVELEKEGYKVCHINLENFKQATESDLFDTLYRSFRDSWNIQLRSRSLTQFFNEIMDIREHKFVFICDEIEGLNPELFNQFLHTIRNLYHFRENHSLKSVILVGVSNITGIIQDNASPFNIADDLPIPYFTNEETAELLSQHEQETGQLFAKEVKDKISEITANQPGLVNGFAKVLVDRHPDKPTIELPDYEEVEEWYLNKAIDKNIANIIKIAKQHRPLLERLLFNEIPVPFKIDDPTIEKLHVNGLITYNQENNIVFWVPLYKKRLHEALYPYTNGEGRRISETMLADSYLTTEGLINFDKLIDSYRNHIRARSFRPFREKDDKGNFVSIPEAAMIYSFETFISIFIQEIEGKIYREPIVTLGNSDMVINVQGKEYYIETKKYYSPSKFQKGKKQLAYYVKRAGLKEGAYIVFLRNELHPDLPNNNIEVIEDITIKTYMIRYDEEKDF